MEKEQLGGYCEFVSRLVDQSLDVRPPELLRAVDESAVHTFGWPIAPVLHGTGFAPVPNEHGLTATIDAQGHFDYWTLKRNGDFYVLKSLFEDDRKANCIFLDTRTIRTAEIYYRTANLYLSLGIDHSAEIETRIEYGGLLNRTLTVASSRRHVIERTCTGNVATRTFRGPISEFAAVATIKDKVYEVILSITEMCDFFTPERSVIDEIVENYVVHDQIP